MLNPRHIIYCIWFNSDFWVSDLIQNCFPLEWKWDTIFCILCAIYWCPVDSLGAVLPSKLSSAYFVPLTSCYWLTKIDFWNLWIVSDLQGIRSEILMWIDFFHPPKCTLVKFARRSWFHGYVSQVTAVSAQT